jgi:CRISPR-associated protein Csm5
MTLYHFRALALTPIHVGNGEIFTPEDYLIQGDTLIRFHCSAVLRDMNTELHQQLEAALERNNFTAAQEILRTAVDPQRHTLHRTVISDESRVDLLTLIKHPESSPRNREVHPFVFNPQDSRPYLPGSAIKGAIRTALVNFFTQQHLKTVAPEVAREREKNRKWRILETKALNFEFNRMGTDPLRLLKVADVPLPPDLTRLDRVLLLQHGKDPTDLPMHYERLSCRGDDSDTTFAVEMEWNEAAAVHSQVRIGRTLDFELIRMACNRFFMKRMRAEQAYFFKDDVLPEARYGAQGLIKFQPDKLMVIKSIQERGLLLRIGRFCHFESLSVEELREGWNIKKKKPIKEMSNSRTLCRCRSEVRGGSMPLPFGWLLLMYESAPPTPTPSR